MLESFFQLKERNTTVKTEIMAGLTTFMTKAYIIFVNPQILNFFGDAKLSAIALPFSATMTATCLSAGVLCIVMRLYTNYPITMAAGMVLNAVVAYQLVLGEHLPYPSAMEVIVLLLPIPII